MLHDIHINPIAERPRNRTPQAPSICFVAPHAYAAVAGRTDLPHIGGAEVQQALVAKALVQRGCRVSFVTEDHGQPDGIEHDGITVFKLAPNCRGLPGLRFFHPRWTSLWHAMARANADVYYQRAAGCETGQVATWCRLRRRPFVFAAASDTNCEPGLLDLARIHERSLYRMGLRLANRVVCQTAYQQSSFRSHFATPATIIRSCARDPFDGRRIHRDPCLGPPRLLWVGRFHPKKRLEWFLDLAEQNTGLQCDIIGDTREGDSYGHALVQRAKRIPHITLHGRLPHHAIGGFYDRADLLLCTSPREGFPNTFLEAWSRGTPTVSTVDPDGVIVANGLGAIGGNVGELLKGAMSLLEAPDRWRECSQRARTHFLKNHAVSAAADAYLSLLTDLVADKHRRQ